MLLKTARYFQQQYPIRTRGLRFSQISGNLGKPKRSSQGGLEPQTFESRTPRLNEVTKPFD